MVVVGWNQLVLWIPVCITVTSDFVVCCREMKETICGQLHVIMKSNTKIFHVFKVFHDVFCCVQVVTGWLILMLSE